MLFGQVAKRLVAALMDGVVKLISTTSPKYFVPSGFLFTVLLMSTGSFASSDSCSGSFANSDESEKRKLIVPTDEKSDSINARLYAAQDAIRSESHDFLSLLDSNPDKNLLVKHPFSAMNAFQRLHAIHRKYPPVIKASASFSTELVPFYPLYHRPLEANGGMFLAGHQELVRAYNEYIAEGANTRARSSKTFTLIGSPGTGKTLFVEIANRLLEYHTTFDPDCFLYTFEWQHLEMFPELDDLIGSQIVKNNSKNEVNWVLRSAAYESPLVLVPVEYQTVLLNMIRDRVIHIAGVTPQPNRTPTNQQTEYMRRLILDHYAKEKGSELTPQEVIAYLQKHVRIVRHILGETGSGGKIGYQGTDIDWSGLIAQTNAVVSSIHGASHPFAYHLNGKIIQNQGGILAYDEWYRNKDHFQDWNLDVQESRVIQRGGMAKIDLDAVIIAASNTESVNKKSGEGQSGASIDRSAPYRMNANIAPTEVAKELWIIKGLEGLRSSKLLEASSTDTELSPFEPANLLDLYPDRDRRGDPILTPYGRYALTYDTGPRTEPVWIAPHTVELIAYVVAATRMVTNPQEAVKFGGHYNHTINLPVFRDEIQRLRAYMGKLPITDSVSMELDALSRELEEGSKGITTRNAGKIWLREVISAAQRPGNENTATPALAREALIKLMRDNTIQVPSTSERARWLSLLDAVSHQLIAPAIQADVNRAISEGSEDIDALYDEIVFELVALNEDGAAKTYKHPSGDILPIKLDRLKRISEIYEEVNKRPIAYREIVNLMLFDQSQSIGSKRRHPGLLDALNQFQAELELKKFNWRDLAKYASGGSVNHQTRERADSIMRFLHLRLGYNRKSLLDSISLIHDMQVATRQVGN